MPVVAVLIDHQNVNRFKDDIIPTYYIRVCDDEFVEDHIPKFIPDAVAHVIYAIMSEQPNITEDRKIVDVKVTEKDTRTSKRSKPTDKKTDFDPDNLEAMIHDPMKYWTDYHDQSMSVLNRNDFEMELKQFLIEINERPEHKWMVPTLKTVLENIKAGRADSWLEELKEYYKDLRTIMVSKDRFKNSSINNILDNMRKLNDKDLN